MKRIFVALLFFILFENFVHAQYWGWAKSASSSGPGEGYNTCTDLVGNVYINGTFFGTLVFGTHTVTSSGSEDICLVKYDGSGNVLWAKSIGGTGTEWLSTVATDSQGYVFVSGTFGSSIMIVGTNTLVNTGFNDMFLIKFDPSGNVMWATKGGGTSDDRTSWLTVDATGNPIVSGYYASSQIIFGTYTLTNSVPGSKDAFIIKYDALGNIKWVKSANGTNADSGYGVTSDNKRNVYFTGDFNSPMINFGTTTLSLSAGEMMALFIVKFDSLGNAQWAKKIPGTFNALVAHNNIVADSYGGLYLTGNFTSGSVAFGNYTLTNSSTSVTADYFITKYDFNGNVKWSKGAGGPKDDYGYNIAPDNYGRIYVTGGFDTTSVFTLGSYTISKPSGSKDPMFVVQYDSLGNEICATTLASGGDDEAYVSSDPFGNAYISGDFLTNPFVVGANTMTLTGGEKIFVAQFSCQLGLATKDKFLSQNFNVYPNPGMNEVNILTELNGTVDYTIVDVLGKVIQNGSFVQSASINTALLDNGTYVLKLKSGNTAIYKRLIINK